MSFTPPVSITPPTTTTLASRNPLQIGPVTFLDEETPNELDLKLNQILATHVLIGGSRTIQALGPSMEDITWKGYLFAGNVEYRIGQLETMQVAAQPVTLSYLAYAYQVIIKNFTWKFEHKWQAQYEITVTVLEDISGNYATVNPSGIDQQVSSISPGAEALINAIYANDVAGFTAAQAACNLMFQEIEIAGILSQLSGPALQALIEAIAVAIIAVQEYQQGLL